MDFYTIDDFNFKGKTAIVRVDINCPLAVDGSLMESERIAAHAKTLKELSEKKAKLVVLAHQGRAGESDLISLAPHAKALSKHLGFEVKFTADHFGAAAQNSVKNLREGEVLLLENTRMLEEETLKLSVQGHGQSKIVQALSPLAQIFVCDAFSAAHRSQATVVGFTETLPSCAGRVMQSEYENAQKVCAAPARPNIYILGGAKPEECFGLMKKALANGTVDKILLSGVIANAALLAKNVEMGQPTQKFISDKGYQGFVEEFRQLNALHGEKIIAPIDLAFEENGQRKEAPIENLPQGKLFLDIGPKTASLFSSIIAQAKTIYLKGPQGVFENPLFEYGTKTTLNAIANSSAFSFTGGGHTDAALDKFGIPRNKISFRSIAGGALLEMLEGKKLPAIEALKENKKKFKSN